MKAQATRWWNNWLRPREWALLPSVIVAAILASAGVLFITFLLYNPWHVLDRLNLFPDTTPLAWKDRLTFAAATITGVGALFALVIAYRKQRDTENTRFGTAFAEAAAQLGGTSAAVRIAGAYATAALADQHPRHRQQCIDTLCGYLRLPYTPRTDSATKETITHPLTGDTEDIAASPEKVVEIQHLPGEREVRLTIIRIIRDHLREGAPTSWEGHDFDFTGATFDGGDFCKARFSVGYVDFTGATFSGGTVDFTGATFSGGTVDFTGATFSRGTVDFTGATFSDGTVTFIRANFSGGTVTFIRANFSGALVDFLEATFSGGSVSFDSARFSSGEVNIGVATFSGGTVTFNYAKFSGSTVDFTYAEFSGGTVAFTYAEFSGGTVTFLMATFSGGTIDFRMAKFSEGDFTFRATFAGGTVDFTKTTFSGGTVDFIRAEFSGATVSFAEATFSGGTVDFTEAEGDPWPLGPWGDERIQRWPLPES